MRRLLPIILALFLAVTWFVTATFAHFEGLGSWCWTVVPILLTASFIPTTMLSQRMRSRRLRALNVISGISIGFLNYFLAAALASWIAIGVSRLAGIPVPRGTVASVAYGAAALVGTFALFSGYWLRVTRVSVRLPQLPAFWHGRTIALVSDIHLGNFRGTASSRRIVTSILGLRPECILVAGDFFDGVKIDVGRAVGPWSDLSAPSGVYFVGETTTTTAGGRRILTRCGRWG